MIGDDIEVFILDCQNDKIRVGINAPKDVQVLRKELYETKKSNAEAVISLSKDKLVALKKSLKKEENENTKLN